MRRHMLPIVVWLALSTIGASQDAVGRLVDDRRFPLEGVAVYLSWSGGMRQAATTDAEGRFRFALPDAKTDADGYFGIRAEDASGRVALVDVLRDWCESGEFVCEGLEFKPADAVVLRVNHQGRSVAGASVWVKRHFGPPVANWTTDERGELRLPRLPFADYEVLIRGPGLHASRIMRTPLSSLGPIEFAMLPAVDVEFEFVDSETKAPIPGVCVEGIRLAKSHVDILVGTSVKLTDSRGRTRVTALPLGVPLQVFMSAPAYERWSRDFVVDGIAEPVTQRIELQPKRGYYEAEVPSWRILPGDDPVPVDGTELRVTRGDSKRLQSKAGSGWIEGGYLHFRSEFFEHGSRVLLPNGAFARPDIPDPIFASKPRSQTITFRKPRRVEVIVRTEDGAPVPGMRVIVWDPPSFAWIPSDERHKRFVRWTGETGRVHVDGIVADEVNVYVGDDIPWGDEKDRCFGRLDLAGGDAVLDVKLAPPMTVTVRQRIDGRPRLGACDLSVRNAVFRRIIEDPQAGTNTIEAYPRDSSKPIIIQAWSPRHRPTSVSVPYSASARPAQVDIDLRSGNDVLVDVMPPADNEYSIGLFTKGGGSRSTGTVIGTANLDGRMVHRYSFRDVGVGRFRVVDKLSGLASAETVIQGEHGISRLSTLDLSRTCWIRGRVTAPSDADSRDVRVIVEGGRHEEDTGNARRRPGHGVDDDGSFRARTQGQSPMRLRTWHPRHLPSPATGVTATDPNQIAELALVEGPVAWFQVLDEGLGARYELCSRVLLFRPGDRTSPVSEHRVYRRFELEGSRFGGFIKGRYDVIIDNPVCAPLLIEDVDLTRDDNALGVVRFSDGGSLRVHTKVWDGIEAGGSISAEFLGQPGYVRDGPCWSEGDYVIVPGLGPGRFRVTYTKSPGDEPQTIGIIKVDGHSSFDLNTARD